VVTVSRADQPHRRQFPVSGNMSPNTATAGCKPATFSNARR
jgi:hypothetical protein